MTAQQLATIDLADVDLFAGGPPHDLFARMRRDDPVRWNPTAEQVGEPFWSLTRAAHIAEVSRDTETFSSHEGGIWFRPDMLAPLDLARNLLLFKDPPEHTKYRLIIQSAFTPHTVAKLERTIRDRVNELLDTIEERGSFDVVADLAVPLPLSVITELLGAPGEDVPQLYAWTQLLEDAHAQDTDDGLAALGEMTEYIVELVASERRRGEDGLVNRLLAAEVDGQRLTDLEVVLFFAVLVFAGNDTTRNATSGGALALIEHPDQHALLRAEPERIPAAVEEILRWTTPINYFARTATRDTAIDGVDIQTGQRLVMWYCSGSRDEALVDQPHRFDVTRRPAHHQAFGGGGRHFCLGAGLSRLELRVMFEELTRRVHGLELAGEPVRTRSTWVNGFRALPAVINRAARPRVASGSSACAGCPRGRG